MRLGGWLRGERRRKGAPLRVVAAAADMDTALLSKIELGQRLPTEAQTGKLARFLGVDELEMHARRIVEKFWQEHGDHPAAAGAIRMLAGDAAARTPRAGR
jgi:transcriptional regulator with XRE-family HTH domain